MTLAAPDPTVHSAYRFGAFALLIAAGSILIALASSTSAAMRRASSACSSATPTTRVFRCCFWRSSP